MKDGVVGAVGAVIGAVAMLLAVLFQHDNNIDLWQQQERFQYQKFLLENRIQLFERFQRVIASPTHDFLRENGFICADQKCEDYKVEFQTTIALIREFFPNAPKKLIEEEMVKENIDLITLNKEFLYEISASMSDEFNYQLYGFGYSDDEK